MSARALRLACAQSTIQTGGLPRNGKNSPTCRSPSTVDMNSLGPSITSRPSHGLVKITIPLFASDNTNMRHAYMIPRKHGKDAEAEDFQPVCPF